MAQINPLVYVWRRTFRIDIELELQTWPSSGVDNLDLFIVTMAIMNFKGRSDNYKVKAAVLVWILLVIISMDSSTIGSVEARRDRDGDDGFHLVPAGAPHHHRFIPGDHDHAPAPAPHPHRSHRHLRAGADCSSPPSPPPAIGSPPVYGPSVGADRGLVPEGSPAASSPLSFGP